MPRVGGRDGATTLAADAQPRPYQSLARETTRVEFPLSSRVSTWEEGPVADSRPDEPF